MHDASTSRLSTGDKIAIAIGALALVGGVAAGAIEHAFPGTSVNVWRVILFVCIIVGVCTVAYLIYDLAIRPRAGTFSWRAVSWGKMVAAVVLMLAVSGLLFHSTLDDEDLSDGEPVIQHAPGVISRADKFVFSCDAPAPGAAFGDQIKALGELLGFDISLSLIPDGYRISVEAKTPEAKNRFASAGIVASVTTLNAEIRTLRPGAVIVAFSAADLPKELSILSRIPVDPSIPQIAIAENKIAELLNGKEHACHLI